MTFRLVGIGPPRCASSPDFGIRNARWSFFDGRLREPVRRLHDCHDATVSVMDLDTGQGKFKAIETGLLNQDFGNFDLTATANPLKLGTNVALHYELNMASPALEMLGVNEVGHDALTFQSFDGTALQTITFDIFG